jgi:hypothetical protein
LLSLLALTHKGIIYNLLNFKKSVKVWAF